MLKIFYTIIKKLNLVRKYEINDMVIYEFTASNIKYGQVVRKLKENNYTIFVASERKEYPAGVEEIRSPKLNEIIYKITPEMIQLLRKLKIMPQKRYNHNLRVVTIIHKLKKFLIKNGFDTKNADVITAIDLIEKLNKSNLK